MGDTIKIDLLVFDGHDLLEVSCNYYLDRSALEKTPEELRTSLLIDVKKYYSEGNLYKMLKRLYSLNEVLGNMETLKQLEEFFNSNSGLLNQIKHRALLIVEALEEAIVPKNMITRVLADLKSKVPEHLRNLCEIGKLDRLLEVLSEQIHRDVTKFLSLGLRAEKKVRFHTGDDEMKGGGLLDSFIKDGYLTRVANIIKKHAHSKIERMTLARTPIPRAMDKLMNLLSAGQLESVKKRENYDSFYHLHLNIYFSSGSKVTLEKNEVINIVENKTVLEGTETLPIRVQLRANLTLGTLLENTEKRMGPRYFRYNAKSNNCQDFIESVLLANGISERKYLSFVKQDAHSIFKGKNILRQTANSLTDIAAAGRSTLDSASNGIRSLFGGNAPDLPNSVLSVSDMRDIIKARKSRLI